MSSLVNFTENLKDSRIKSLLDYLNYMHETKNNDDKSDSLSKCIILCGELFANQVKKGEKTQEDVEAFETNLVSQKIFPHVTDLELANTIVREGNAVALTEYESTFGEEKNVKELKKIA